MGYTYDAADIEHVNNEIKRLEHEQAELKKRADKILGEIANIDTRIGQFISICVIQNLKNTVKKE